MANKKQLISVVAASVLAASFTFTGCGSSSSSSTPPASSSSSSSNGSSSSAGPVMIKVSDAYVLNANVTAGSATAIVVGNGDYEFNSTISGMIVSEGGANDVAEPFGEATDADPIAPAMSAPEGYTNVNPFTTMLASKTAEEIAVMYPAAGDVNGTDGMAFNFDVVAAGSENLDIAKETAKAALTVSGYTGTPGSSSSMMSSSSSSDDNTSPFPAAQRADECVPTFPGDCQEPVSSSSEAASSSSEDNGDGAAFEAIDNCADTACIDDVVLNEMLILNGHYPSETSSSSISSSSSLSSSSSSDGDNPFPAAGR